MALIGENTAEMVSREELEQLLKTKKQPVAYCGYEPSGPIHLGHLLTISKLLQMEKAGFKIKILLADWHAFLNQKGSWEEIRSISKDWEKTMKKLGLKKAEFVLGSSFQMKPKYFEDVLTMATHSTLSRGLRSMQEVARDTEHAKISQIIYPLMQIADVKHLGIDVAQAGLEQRKIYMLGRELLETINYKKNILVFTPLINSLQGEGKMSSSKTETMISVNDSAEQIQQKISKAFCPEGIAEKNPVLEIAKLVLFPRFGAIEVNRPEKFGGNKEFSSYTELESDFIQKKLHPMDLKKTIGEKLAEMLEK